jgi:hypothetical protein
LVELALNAEGAAIDVILKMQSELIGFQLKRTES